ncbi:MAG: DUF3267 domain-containing protein [Oscillospiraceae bacterium]|nr:DUF3267 domain-containing protein [Oscillospiraceae bacterium]
MKKEKDNEKEKKLTEAEQKRAERFARISEEMVQQGYTRHDLTIGMGKANLFAVFLLIPLSVIGYGLYFLVHRSLDFASSHFLLMLVAFVVLIVVHELIHGVCWSIFTPHHFKDVEFGVMRSSLTPYCTCLVPLGKKQYIFGAVMPLLVLGILPMIVAIIIGNPDLLFLGILMADGGAGDIMIIHRILTFRSGAKEIVYMDHPTEAGGVVFER